MRFTPAYQSLRCLFKCAAIIAAICLVGPECRAQDKPAGGQTQTPSLLSPEKYPGLQEELGKLLEKLQHIQYPAARTESHLLPLLFPSTVSCATLPNYGSTAKQVLEILRQTQQESPAFREWWQRGEMASTGPKLESFLEKFSQLHQYLGEEIVISAEIQGRQPHLLVIAEVRKPGMKEFLNRLVEELGGRFKTGVRVLDPEELGATLEAEPRDELAVLVRPDFAVASEDLATLRNFSAWLDAGSREFASTPFAQRIFQEFPSGLTILAAVDLREILNQIPPAARQSPAFQRTGFADMEYFVWEHKSVADKTVSQSELSFTAPRHGIASWLAKSGPLGSLDFVSPRAMAAGTVLLKDPAQIFEEVRELATLSDPNAFAALEQFEQALQLSLKGDLLSHLGGELTLELDNIAPPLPTWKAILGVKDSERLQQTLNTLLAALPVEVQHADDGGITYHTVRIPSSAAAIEIGYSIVDGYLVVGSGRDVVADAVSLHQSGASLGRSKKLQASLPPGHSQEASGMLYVDPVTMTALQLQRLAPEMVPSLIQGAEETTPAVVYVDGQETAIRQATTSPALDAGVVLVVAAIAIPNLLRARITANETSAVGSLRTVNVAQVQYAATYERGFAPNLATLGPGPSGAGPATEDHADLLDGLLAGPTCTGDAWCTKSGYRFVVAGICTQGRCEEYVVVAAPITPGTTGTRSFCSTSDGLVRHTTGTPPASSPSVAECQMWPPL